MVQEITKEHPILFSTSMVQAILQGSKTQTRRTRALEFINDSDCEWSYEGVNESGHIMLNQTYGSRNAIKSPYGSIGDVLWVRETWMPENVGSFGREKLNYWYKATDAEAAHRRFKPEFIKWKPSIHMPKAACRIRLEITDIRVERLRDISEDDAKAEGATPFFKVDAADFLRNPKLDFDKISTHKNGFENIWKNINGEESWNLNPWVWVVEFKKL